MIIRFDRGDKQEFQEIVECISKSNSSDDINDLFHSNSGKYLI